LIDFVFGLIVTTLVVWVLRALLRFRAKMGWEPDAEEPGESNRSYHGGGVNDKNLPYHERYNESDPRSISYEP
jgi:hypothetical protein